MENNNEIMEIEEMDVVEAGIADDENSGMSTGAAMLAGVVLTVAVAGVVKLGKRVIGKFKARKEARKNDDDLVEVSDDENDEDVTK